MPYIFLLDNPLNNLQRRKSDISLSSREKKTFIFMIDLKKIKQFITLVINRIREVINRIREVINRIREVINRIREFFSDLRGVLLRLQESQKKIFSGLKIREREEKIKMFLEELLFQIEELLKQLLLSIEKLFFEILKICYRILDNFSNVLDRWYSFLYYFDLTMFCEQNKIILYWSIRLGDLITVALRIIDTFEILIEYSYQIVKNFTFFILMLSKKQYTSYALQRLVLRVAILSSYLSYFLNLVYRWNHLYSHIDFYFLLDLQSAGYPARLIDFIFFTHKAVSFYVLFWFHQKITSGLIHMIDMNIGFQILKQLYVFYQAIAGKFRDLVNKKDITKEDKEKQDKEKDSQNQNEE